MRDRFDLLVFDWDGTLIDSIDWIVGCLQRAAREHGFPVPDEQAAKQVIGLSLSRAMRTLFPDANDDTVDKLMHAYRGYYNGWAIGADDLFDGVAGLLENLRAAGYRLAIATGKARGGLDDALAATAVGHFFDASRCADETASKPHPKMLLQLMDEVRVPPERTLMIGDSLHDLRMAHNAGIAAVGVACGANTREELLALNPLTCLRHPVELLALLV
jgi:phosphoglycolate phosphatase